MTDMADHVDLPGALRALRRRADLSQRELAARSGVPPATVGSIESGGSPNPGFRTVDRLVAAAGARLAIVDVDGSEPVRLGTDGWRDHAHRRFPPHVDVYPVTWRGARRVDGFEFVRSRYQRDLNRRYAAGERREGVSYEVRRLGPGDQAVLAALRTGSPDLDPAGRPAPDSPPLTGEEALHYLRDPSLRHWIAAERVSGRILGHLVAHVHRRYTGRSAIVVHELGIRRGHRDGPVGDGPVGDSLAGDGPVGDGPVGDGLVGIRLVAAMGDEAARLGVKEVVALAEEPAVARCLVRLGFRRRWRRPLLTLPW